MHPLIRTVLQRLGLGALTLFIVSVVIFSLVEMLPGDFASSILGQAATKETVAALNHQLGLDQPAPTRYLGWVGSALTGDLGNSFSSRPDEPRPVVAMIVPRLKNTLFLAGLTAAISIPLALLLGVLAALHRNSMLDRGVNAVALATISMPEFLMAYILIVVFAVKLRIFPALATVNDATPLGERLARCALPALTLTMVIVAHMLRMTRASIIGLMGSPYIEMARMKGIGAAKVVLRHALPNAWAPIVNVIAINIAYLIVGVVVVEAVFTYPGIGQLMVDAVRTRDIPVVQGCGMVFAVTYILLNLLADIISIASNPRLLHPR